MFISIDFKLFLSKKRGIIVFKVFFVAHGVLVYYVTFPVWVPLHRILTVEPMGKIELDKWYTAIITQVMLDKAGL